GRGMAAALALGAQGVWMGTRFAASREAHLAESYKKRVTEIGEDQTVVTRCYSGKPMRVIRNAYVDDWERRPDEIQPFPNQALVSIRGGVFSFMQPELTEDVDPDRDCIPCGQGAGAVRDIPTCAEIIDRVVGEARETIQKLAELL
ncbi:nitronate monooxygenase, partial [bacterium]|nr:nitronate monooxygenase [bacterium]